MKPNENLTRSVNQTGIDIVDYFDLPLIQAELSSENLQLKTLLFS